MLRGKIKTQGRVGAMQVVVIGRTWDTIPVQQLRATIRPLGEDRRMAGRQLLLEAVTLP
jgi:hypothetical protein